MNREIRFRAWDKTIGEWSDAFNIDNDGTLYPAATKHNGDIVLMQYTGLKDKDGVEIFEGDILRFPNPTDSAKPFLRRVEMFNGCWCGYSDTVHMDYQLGYMALYGNIDDAEVIGNIYDNPELAENTSK